MSDRSNKYRLAMSNLDSAGRGRGDYISGSQTAFIFAPRSLKQLFEAWCLYISEASITEDYEARYLNEKWVRLFVEWKINDNILDTERRNMPWLISNAKVDAYLKALNKDVAAKNGFIKFCIQFEKDGFIADNFSKLAEDIKINMFIKEYLALEGKISVEQVKAVFDRSAKPGPNLIRFLKIKLLESKAMLAPWFDGCVREQVYRGKYDIVHDISRDDIPKVNICADWLWQARIRQGLYTYSVTTLIPNWTNQQAWQLIRIESGKHLPNQKLLFQLINLYPAYCKTNEPSENEAFVRHYYKLLDDCSERTLNFFKGALKNRRVLNDDERKAGLSPESNYKLYFKLCTSFGITVDHSEYALSKCKLGIVINSTERERTSPRRNPLSELLIKCRGSEELRSIRDKLEVIGYKITKQHLSHLEMGKSCTGFVNADDAALQALAIVYKNALDKEFSNWGSAATTAGNFAVLKSLRDEQRYLNSKERQSKTPDLFSELIRNTRNSLGLSGATAAEKLEVSSDVLLMWERGKKPNAEKIDMLAESYGLPEALLHALNSNRKCHEYSRQWSEALHKQDIMWPPKKAPDGIKTFAERVADKSIKRVAGQTL